MKNTRVLEIAKAKLHFIAGLNQLCAYLTPAEIHSLIDAGYNPTDSCADCVPPRNEPKPFPTWFYFQPVRGEFYDK